MTNTQQQQKKRVNKTNEGREGMDMDWMVEKWAGALFGGFRWKSLSVCLYACLPSSYRFFWCFAVIVVDRSVCVFVSECVSESVFVCMLCMWCMDQALVTHPIASCTVHPRFFLLFWHARAHHIHTTSNNKRGNDRNGGGVGRRRQNYKNQFNLNVKKSDHDLVPCKKTKKKRKQRKQNELPSPWRSHCGSSAAEVQYSAVPLFFHASWPMAQTDRQTDRWKTYSVQTDRSLHGHGPFPFFFFFSETAGMDEWQ